MNLPQVFSPLVDVTSQKPVLWVAEDALKQRALPITCLGADVAYLAHFALRTHRKLLVFQWNSVPSWSTTVIMSLKIILVRRLTTLYNNPKFQVLFTTQQPPQIWCKSKSNQQLHQVEQNQSNYPQVRSPATKYWRLLVLNGPQFTIVNGGSSASVPYLQSLYGSFLLIISQYLMANNQLFVTNLQGGAINSCNQDSPPLADCQPSINH